MLEELKFTPYELAREFYDDSAHIKRDQSEEPVTLESLAEVASAYFKSHPEYRGIDIYSSDHESNPAPTALEVQQGTYVLNKLDRIH